MFSRKLYGTAAATANNVANIVVPGNARLIGVQWAVDINSSADDASCILELSAASATEIAVNDAQQCLSEIRVLQTLVTSGMIFAGIQQWVPIPMVPVAQGQRLYLHTVIAGTLTFRATAMLWFA